jgi:hypothetical protein
MPVKICQTRVVKKLPWGCINIWGGRALSQRQWPVKLANSAGVSCHPGPVGTGQGVVWKKRGNPRHGTIDREVREATMNQ